MRTVIYKIVFLEKNFEVIKQNFSFFCSLLVYIIKFILIYMQLIFIIEKFLKKNTDFFEVEGAHIIYYFVLYIFEFLYTHSYAKEQFLNKNPLNISAYIYCLKYQFILKNRL